MGRRSHREAARSRSRGNRLSPAWVVRSWQIDFLKPARIDDVLDVVTWPVAVKGASITLSQEVRRRDHLLVKAEVRVAFISEGRAQPIPKSLRALMKADLD
jgi:acyl-CoA thioester hydrolase